VTDLVPQKYPCDSFQYLQANESEETCGDSLASNLPPEFVRLYVAGLPKTMGEAALKPLFDQVSVAGCWWRIVSGLAAVCGGGRRLNAAHAYDARVDGGCGRCLGGLGGGLGGIQQASRKHRQTQQPHDAGRGGVCASRLGYTLTVVVS